MYKISLMIIAFAALLMTAGCRELLEEKSDLKLSTPITLEDNQALIDQFGFANTQFAGSGETSSDDYYLTDADFNSLYYEQNKRLYTWMPDHVAGSSSTGNDWLSCYRAVYISNAVLHNLQIYQLSGPAADNVKGQALALRAARFLDAAQIWCLVYNEATASTDLGLPLRLDPDLNTPTVRATLRETYAQIIRDLSDALPLLPDHQVSKIRMSKTAVYGLLARTYLFMGNYEKALEHADNALNLQNTLMNFNDLDPDVEYTIPDFNEEITFWGAMNYEYHLIPAKIPAPIFNSYNDDDLRKEVYFMQSTANEILFTGYYNNANGPSTAVAVDELYLIAAECHARLNQVSLAMDKLNELLVTRWRTGTFVNFTAANKEEALALIIAERRKELLIRGLRWSDLKRYNRDGANMILKRTVNGQTFQLPPNDLRYAIAIPEEIIAITHIPQNPR